MLYSPLRVRAYQPTAGLVSISLQTEVKDHAASFRGTCGHHIKSPLIWDKDYWITAINQWLPKFLTMLS